MKKVVDKQFINKLNSHEKDTSILLLFLTTMKEGEIYVSPVGKITKLSEDTFKISVDQGVIEKGLSKLFDEYKNPLERLFS